MVVEQDSPRAPASSDEFAAWVRPHLFVMRRLAWRLAPDHDPDDVVQESLVRASRRHETYDGARGTARSWLLAVTADQARRARGRWRWRPVAMSAAAPESDWDADVDLHRALWRLTERQRLAIDLVYYVDLPLSEAARVMGCSEGTVKSTLHDARERLRSLLEVTE